MNSNAKYDVFISYSRKDYVDEQDNPISELLKFLDQHEITYWFDRNGVYSGSEFAEIITDAITDSKMMIFVSSEHSNASPWTTGEIFEAMGQKKLIVPFKIDNSQYNKKYRIMMHPLDFIEYYTNPEIAFKSLLQAINICKDKYNEIIKEEARRKAEEASKLRRAKIIEEIEADSLDYKRHALALAEDAHKIAEKQKEVGNYEKKCPVCSSLQPIENTFCKKCGWTFAPTFDANPQGDKDHLFAMRSLWKAVQDSDSERKKIEIKIHDQELAATEKDKKIESYQEELSRSRKKLDATEVELDATRVELSHRQKMLETTKDELEATKEELNATKEELYSRIKNLEERNIYQEYQIKCLNEENGHLKDEINCLVAENGYLKDEINILEE